MLTSTIRIFQKIVGLGAEAHLNTCFKHFIYFVHEFKLIDPKELQPLKDLIDSLMGKEKEVKREDRPERKSKKKKDEDKKGGEAGEATPAGAGEKEKGPEKEKEKGKEGEKPSPTTVPVAALPPTKAPS